MAGAEFAPVTPGEMLKDEFLEESGPSQNQLAKAIGISPNRPADIVKNRRRITADTALRLGLYFGNSPEFWMNLQAHYDLKMARRNLTPRMRGASRLGALPSLSTSLTDPCTSPRLPATRNKVTRLAVRGGHDAPPPGPWTVLGRPRWP